MTAEYYLHGSISIIYVQWGNLSPLCDILNNFECKQCDLMFFVWKFSGMMVQLY